jgi:hypothetical protein
MVVTNLGLFRELNHVGGRKDGDESKRNQRSESKRQNPKEFGKVLKLKLDG